MACEMQKLAEDYANWLSRQITVRHAGEYVEITTPFLDRDNDCIQIYVREADDGRYLLTDGGYTISNLAESGIVANPDGENAGILQTTLNGFGVSLMNGDELAVYASNETFPQVQHNLIMAVLTINTMGLWNIKELEV